jgi:hypothetical protein
MDPVTEARAIATNTPYGSPAYQLAIGVCMVRGINPDYPSGAGLPNWQSVIMEAVLTDYLHRLIASL